MRRILTSHERVAVWHQGEHKQDAFGTWYDPEHLIEPTPRGWPEDVCCRDPDHHGQIAGRCAECHKPVKHYSGLSR